MFWWRKRNEGFEWRDYVRTTILVRREQRRQKLKDVQAAASAQVKEAGKRGLDAGVAGARSAGTGAWAFARASAQKSKDWAVRGGRAAASGAASAATSLRSGANALAQRVGTPLAPALEPVLSFAREPRVNLALKVVTVAAALGAAYRAWVFGFDADAVVAAVLAAIAGALVVLAVLTDPYRSRRGGTRENLLARLREKEFELPGNRRLSGATAGFALAGILALGVTGWALVHYGFSGPASQQTTARRTASVTAEPDPSKLEGRASAVSGDALRVAGKLVKLDGIEAPEAEQSCQRQNRTWKCGAAAKEALAGIVRGQRVSCDIVHEDDTAATARCYTRGIDIAEQLVRNGHVFSDGGFLSAYAGVEGDAQSEKVGLWSGDADRPQDYRDKRWAEAKKTAPDGCPIKGRIQSGTRTYILPWNASYDRVRLRTSRGERWFCSESEAQAAGWSRGSSS